MKYFCENNHLLFDSSDQHCSQCAAAGSEPIKFNCSGCGKEYVSPPGAFRCPSCQAVTEVVGAAGSEREAFENAREDFAEKFDTLGARIVARQGFHAGYELGMRQAARAAAPPNGGFLCAARHGDVGANDPQDCNWPFCGCDQRADKVIEAIQESGFKIVREAAAPAPPSREEEK